MSSVSPLSFTPIANATPEENPVDAIRSAHTRNLFTPFAAALDTKGDHCYRESWLAKIKELSSGKEIKEESITACYLFAISVDPELTTETKQHKIALHLKSLKEDRRKSLCYQLQDGLPAVMSTHILQFCSDAIWEQTIQKMLRYSSMHSFQIPITTWMQEIAENRWSKEEKVAFLDRLFEKLPKEKGDEAFYYFHVEKSADTVQACLQVCSEKLQERLNALLVEIIQYGSTLLQELESKPRAVRLPYQNENQRHAFLAWFLTNARDHLHSALIATDCNEKEWPWLHKRAAGVKLCSYAMKWMIVVSKRLGDNSLAQEATLRHHDSHIWLFYSYASKYVEMEKRDGEISDESYRSLAEALTVENLFHYLDAFSTDFKARIIKNTIAHEPAKFVAWIDLIMRAPEDSQNTVKHRIDKLFGLIKANDGLKQLIPLIFAPEQSDTLRLTAFAALPEESLKAILTHLFSDRAAGLKTIAGWLQLAAQNSAELKPFVKDAFADRLSKLLRDIDANVSFDLQNLVMEPLQHSREALEYVDLALAVGVDMNDPITRQKVALKKLKAHFLTPNVPHSDRRTFVGSINNDLRGDLGRFAFVSMLFHELPVETWPLIFLHFEYDLSQGFYNQYYEEKTHGGAFKKTTPMKPPEMKKEKVENQYREVADQKRQELQQDGNLSKLQDVLLWDKLAVIEDIAGSKTPQEAAFVDHHSWISTAAQTLNQMLDNPYLTNQDHGSEIAWAMQPLYQAACERNTIYQIVQRFIETTTPERFVPTMQRLCQSCFFHNRQGFIELVATSLEMANVEKPLFIANCMLAEHSRNSRNSSFVDLETAFWKEPFLKNDEERAICTHKLIADMGMQFLGLFLRNRELNQLMIQSLYNHDPKYTSDAFYIFLKSLNAADDDETTKFVIFQNFCSTYSAVGIDVMALVFDERFKELLEPIKKWFQPEILVKHLHANTLSWRLVRFLAPFLLYPTFFQKVDAIVSEERYVSFYDFNSLLKVMKELNCEASMQRRLFEEHPELVEKLKKVILSHVSDALSCSKASYSLELINQLLPNWRLELQEWVKEQMKKDKEEALQYGSDPSYYKISDLFKNLSTLKILETMLSEMRASGTEEQNMALQVIYDKLKKVDKSTD